MKIAPIDLTIFAIFLIGLIVPRTFDMCVIDTILVLFVKYCSILDKSKSPESVKGKYFNWAPHLFANCCQGTMFA